MSCVFAGFTSLLLCQRSQSKCVCVRARVCVCVYFVGTFSIKMCVCVCVQYNLENLFDTFDDPEKDDDDWTPEVLTSTR